MLAICSTCLSQDRFLKALSSMNEVATPKWVNDFLSPSSMLCWECVADLSSHRFRRRAQEAQDALQMSVRLGFDQAPTLFSLSALTTVTSPQLYQEEWVHTKTEIDLDNFAANHQSVDLDSVEPNFEHIEIHSDLTNTDLPKSEPDLTNVDDFEPDLLCDETNRNSDSDLWSESLQTPDQNFIQCEDQIIVKEDHNLNDADTINVSTLNAMNNSLKVVTVATPDPTLVKDETKHNCNGQTTVELGALDMVGVGAECRLVLRDAAAKCVRCVTPRWFLSPRQLLQHIRAAHCTQPATAQPLPTTDTPTVSGDSYLGAVQQGGSSLHTMGIHRGEKPHPCTSSDEQYVQKVHSTNNIKRVHLDEKPFSCNICNKSFTVESLLNLHMKCYHNTIKPMYSCHLCKTSYSSRERIEKHLIRSHRDCMLPQTTKPDNNPMKLSHPVQRLFTCDTQTECSKTTDTAVNLGKKPYFKPSTEYKKKAQSELCCDICRKKFTDGRMFRKHMLSHAGIKPFACDMCNLKFVNKQNLARHIMSVHRKEKPYSCTSCDKRYAQKVHLNNHIKSVHLREKPFSCNICDRPFTFKYVLATHMEGHKRNPDKIKRYQRVERAERLVKPYLCDLCGKGFFSRHGRKKHMIRKHNTKFCNRPTGTFVCNLCGRKCATKETLNFHIEGEHLGIKPFSCNICDKQFVRSSNRNTHMKNVHNSMPPIFSCDLCKASCSSRQGMIKHLNRSHHEIFCKKPS